MSAARSRWLLPLLWVSLGATALAAPPSELDVLIINARIVDGAGNPWFRGNVGIRDGRITGIGAGASVPARRVIDAADRVIAPGFIDLMGQDSVVYLQDPAVAEGRLRQGITTVVSGEGSSVAPQNRRTQPQGLRLGDRSVGWSRYAEYFRIVEERGVPLNLAHTVGAGQLRDVVMGEADRAPTAAELAEMKRLLEQAMNDGAVGLSSGLVYAPGMYASTEELIELARVAARHGGIYATHLRNESAELLAALDEALRIGREAGIPVHIFHLKAAGQRYWPLMPQAIERISRARLNGQDVTADIYPYVRSGVDLVPYLPPSHLAQGSAAALAALSDPAVRKRLRALMEAPEGDWENLYQLAGADWGEVLLTDSGDYPVDLAGLSIAEAARQESKDVWDMFFDLARLNADSAPRDQDEAQKRLALSEPWVMIETDATAVSPSRVKSAHPRAFGSFPRVLSKYVREEGVLRLEDAVRRMTSMPANRLGLGDRGRIAPGMAADLVIFDPRRIRDRATFEQPLQYAEGVDYLIINGQLAIDAGQVTGAPAGRVLRPLAPVDR